VIGSTKLGLNSRARRAPCIGHCAGRALTTKFPPRPRTLTFFRRCRPFWRGLASAVGTKETTGRRDQHRSLKEGPIRLGQSRCTAAGRIHRPRTHGWREPTRGKRWPGHVSRPRVGFGPCRYSSKRQAGPFCQGRVAPYIGLASSYKIQRHPRHFAALNAELLADLPKPSTMSGFRFMHERCAFAAHSQVPSRDFSRCWRPCRICVARRKKKQNLWVWM
jgi:hypothetical protein